MDTVKIKSMSITEIKEILFSKDTISALNKQVLEKFNLTEVSKESKKKVIDLLIANMKIVYKSLDSKKINNKNINSVFTQFNKVKLDQKMYLLISAGFYLFSIYQNILTCIRFHHNMKKIHTCLEKFKDISLQDEK